MGVLCLELIYYLAFAIVAYPPTRVLLGGAEPLPFSGNCLHYSSSEITGVDFPLGLRVLISPASSRCLMWAA